MMPPASQVIQQRRNGMVESRIGRYSARPGAEIARGVEPRARFVNAPKSFHGEILSNSGVSNDTDNPGVDFLLVLSKQRLEGFQIARCETLQQLHLPLSYTVLLTSGGYGYILQNL